MSDAAARWARAQDVFHAALEQPPAARAAFVRERCGDDAALCAQVLALLAADDSGPTLLDEGVAAAAGRVLADPTALPRERFGPYRATALLGEGGMGVVYRARRDDLDHEVAIKILRDAALSPARRERFAFEQRVLARLEHPAIARLYDADVLPSGTPWFAMELVEGESITDFCRTHALDVPARLRLFRAVCEAVQYAHGQALIHRDLKPSNILVRADGSVKLLDFGIAKSLETLDDSADATRTGLRLMTPAYAAPEQVRGVGLGVHTDVYALGVVLYELLTGRLPFELDGLTPSEATDRILETAPRKPSLITRELASRGAGRGAWNDLDVLCLTAMHRDVARRYRTVDALVRDVDHYLRGEPLEARGDSWGYRAGKFASRHALALGATAAVLLAIVALVSFYTLRLSEARDRAVHATQRRKAVTQMIALLLEDIGSKGALPDSMRVLTLVRMGEERAQELSSDAEQRAELEHTLGGMAVSLQQEELADSLLSRAVRHTFALPNADALSRAGTLQDLANLRSLQDRSAEAESLATLAVAIATREGGDDPEMAGEAYGILGAVYANRGDYAAAVAPLERALRLETVKGRLSAEGEYTLTALANAHFYLGHMVEADSLNRIGLALDRKRFGDAHPNVASDLINLGQIHSQLGKFADAEREYREALAIDRKWFGDEHAETASALTNLGRALISLERFDEAETLLPRALDIVQRVHGAGSPQAAGVLAALSSIASHHEQYDKAVALLDRALTIYRASGTQYAQATGLILSNLAVAELGRHDATKAEAYAREALRTFQGAIPAGHAYFATAHVRLGRALLAQKRYAEAEAESREGYRILTARGITAAAMLGPIRTDLIAEYEALGRGADAARFRAEAAAASAAAH